MVLPRAAVLRAALRSSAARPSRPTTRVSLCRQMGRRSYASHGGHETKKSSSDLPWLIGAVTVTIPSCAYLLKPNPNKDHGHGHGDGEHGAPAEHEENKEQPESEGEGEESTKEGGEDDNDEGKPEDSEGKEEPPADGEDDATDGGDGKSNDSDSGEPEKQDTPDTSDDESSMNVPHETESGGDVEGVQFKGATKDGAKGDTRKHLPDSKGGTKKRIESDYGVRQGTSDEQPERDAEGSKKDKAAASKPALSKNQQSGKQEGLANTDTKHSTDITNNPEKSTKGEGTPETSKSKGTVDPSRPQK